MTIHSTCSYIYVCHIYALISLVNTHLYPYMSVYIHLVKYTILLYTSVSVYKKTYPSIYYIYIYISTPANNQIKLNTPTMRPHPHRGSV